MVFGFRQLGSVENEEDSSKELLVKHKGGLGRGKELGAGISLTLVDRSVPEGDEDKRDWFFCHTLEMTGAVEDKQKLVAKFTPELKLCVGEELEDE